MLLALAPETSVSTNSTTRAYSVQKDLPIREASAFTPIFAAIQAPNLPGINIPTFGVSQFTHWKIA